MSEEKFDVEGFEKLKAAFSEYEAEQKERFKNLAQACLRVARFRRRLTCLAPAG
ncbi:MAG: hypothetical protein ABSF65_07730 [Candidatus Bathyarchaeia archaeon]|jgi:hypothetical protein